MRPSFTDMLAGIESVQSTVVMPRILATGEMDVLWESGFAYRLLGFLKENGGRLVDLVLQENRDIRGLFQTIAPAVEAGIGSLQDPGLAAKHRQWASDLPCGPHEEGYAGGDVPFLERIYHENGRLKNALDDLVLLLEEADGLDPDGSGVPARNRVHESIRLLIRESVSRQCALSEELLKFWRG